MSPKTKSILIVALAAAGAVFTASAFEFQFQFSIEGAGTKKLKNEKLPDGKPLIFPVDEFDLVKNLKPAIASFRNERREKARAEAIGLFQSLMEDSVRVGFILMAREVLDSDQLSDDFYEHYNAEMETVKQVAALWMAYSQDISKVKLWNQAMRTEIRDPETRIEEFEAYTYMSTPPKGGKSTGSTTLSITPSIFQKERGMGFVDFGRSIGLDPGMQLDIPIAGRPGTSLEILTKDSERFIEVLGNLLEEYDTQVLQNDLRLYLAESVLRHEIKSRWFDESMPEEIPNALARFALAQILARSAGKPERAEIFQLMSLISPATPDLAGLSADLEQLKWNELPPDSVSAEVRRAYSYFLMGAMLRGQPESLEIFRRMTDGKMKEPSDFFALAKEVFPDCEAGFSAARDLQLEELERKIARSDKSRKKIESKPEPNSPLSEDYETSQFEGLTIQHPKFLKKAVGEIGPTWGRTLRRKRGQYHEAMSKRPWIEIQNLTDSELDRFKAFGLKRPSRDLADPWAELLAKLAEADRFFSVIFTDTIHIWVKEDVQKVLRNGGRLESFSVGETEDKISFSANFGHVLNELSYDEMKRPGAIEAMKPVMLPLLLKQEAVDGKSKDELVEMLQADDFFGSILNDDTPVERLAEVMGMRVLGMSEVFCFCTLVHELAEHRITENLIASDDRRWFTDGMATYIACEMAADRFEDEEAGWKQLEKMYRIDPENREEMLKNVNLFEWKAGETEERLGDSSPTLLSNARYLYSAKAIRKAVEGRGDDFLKRWHAEIAKTRWNRTTSQTVIDAYDRLTGGDLRKIVESIATDDL